MGNTTTAVHQVPQETSTRKHIDINYSLILIKKDTRRPTSE